MATFQRRVGTVETQYMRCYFWTKYGRCNPSGGHPCKYSHSDNPSYPIADGPMRLAGGQSIAGRNARIFRAWQNHIQAPAFQVQAPAVQAPAVQVPAVQAPIQAPAVQAPLPPVAAQEAPIQASNRVEDLLSRPNWRNTGNPTPVTSTPREPTPDPSREQNGLADYYFPQAPVFRPKAPVPAVEFDSQDSTLVEPQPTPPVQPMHGVKVDWDHVRKILRNWLRLPFIAGENDKYGVLVAALSEIDECCLEEFLTIWAGNFEGGRNFRNYYRHRFLNSADFLGLGPN